MFFQGWVSFPSYRNKNRDISEPADWIMHTKSHIVLFNVNIGMGSLSISEQMWI